MFTLEEFVKQIRKMFITIGKGGIIANDMGDRNSERTLNLPTGKLLHSCLDRKRFTNESEKMSRK